MSNQSVNVKSYLVHYLRTYDRIPFGCLVAIDPDHIGVSVCCPKDHFNKKRAREIALGRAKYTELDYLKMIPNRLVLAYYGDSDDRSWDQPPIPMRDYVEESVEWFRERAVKYFKQS